MTKNGPNGMWNHVMYKHKSDYVRLKPATAPLELDSQVKLAALAPKHRDMIHKAIARWLVKAQAQAPAQVAGGHGVP